MTGAEARPSLQMLMAFDPAIMVVELVQVVRLGLLQGQRIAKCRVAPGYRRRQELGRASYQLETRRASSGVRGCQPRTSAPDLTGGTDFDET